MIGNDYYIAVLAHPLDQGYQDVISIFYLPLIGRNALMLYSVLVSESIKPIMTELKRLCILTSLDINDLEEEIITLERYSLISTFKKDNTYLFKVNNPSTINEFVSNEIYSRLYLQRVGKEQNDISISRYVNKKISEKGYENITHKFDMNLLASWDEMAESVYQNGKKKLYDDDIKITFDYELFLRECDKSSLLFPHKYRSEDNMKAIGQIATIFSIPADKMVKLVARSIDNDNDLLDLEKLRIKAINEKSVLTSEKEVDYSLQPVEFLYRLQNVPVSSADKKLLEYLQIELKMNIEVINILIEYVLKATEGRMSKAYVEKVATTWIRQGIDTAEKAKAQIENEPSKNKKKAKYDVKDMDADESVDLVKLRKELFGE